MGYLFQIQTLLVQDLRNGLFKKGVWFSKRSAYSALLCKIFTPSVTYLNLDSTEAVCIPSRAAQWTTLIDLCNHQCLPLTHPPGGSSPFSPLFWVKVHRWQMLCQDSPWYYKLYRQITIDGKGSTKIHLYPKMLLVPSFNTCNQWRSQGLPGWASRPPEDPNEEENK